MNSGHNVISKYLKSKNESSNNRKDNARENLWVLATLIARVGSSYRKEGAMLFVSSLGECIGVLSGGCLEADIVHKAYKTSCIGETTIIEYDSLKDGYQLGTKNTGCLGKIEILLLPITDSIHCEIERLHQQLELGYPCIVNQRLPQCGMGEYKDGRAFFSEALEKKSAIEPATIKTINNDKYAVTSVKPREKLLLIGGGHDAAPIGQIARQLGWYVYLWDERMQSNNAEYEGCADYFDKRKRESIEDFSFIKNFDGVLLKSHNLDIDSFWLSALESMQKDVDYIGMLGPKDRKQKVIELAELENTGWAQEIVISPAGLALGGDSPESIALSILAQVHQVFNA
ncbi:XdhC family protein [Dasania marina]|uniref:XdhC family protein n=1 Tax=Dasania marina TaxID=471499 RepID=UPI0030DBC282